MSGHFPDDLRALRVVLSHDWLTGMRGGERVLEKLCDLYPQAPLYTLIHHRPSVSETINRHPGATSFLQRIPGIERTYRNFLPFFVPAIASMRAPPCDLLISTSHCVAKGLRPPAGARHLCYCFTPMRYAWVFQEEYFGRLHARRLLADPLMAWLRRWDRRASRRVTRFVAISRHVQDRIRRFYGREADVVYPFIDTNRWTPCSCPTDDFDLIVSALVPYKRIDLAIRAYNTLKRPLKIAGVGGNFEALRALAGPTIEFLGWQSDAVILDLYRRCSALVFPGEEDFGLVPLEAMACGRPVIAFARGGALESVKENVTGIFFHAQAETDLVRAVQECHGRSWNPGSIRAHAEAFGPDRFVDGLAASIQACLRDPA